MASTACTLAHLTQHYNRKTIITPQILNQLNAFVRLYFGSKSSIFWPPLQLNWTFFVLVVGMLYVSWLCSEFQRHLCVKYAKINPFEQDMIQWNIFCNKTWIADLLNYKENNFFIYREIDPEGDLTGVLHGTNLLGTFILTLLKLVLKGFYKSGFKQWEKRNASLRMGHEFGHVLLNRSRWKQTPVEHMQITLWNWARATAFFDILIVCLRGKIYQ